MVELKAQAFRMQNQHRISRRRSPHCGGPPRETGTPRIKSSRTRATLNSAWVHAYLHRVEGDLSNAGYWYRQAGQPVAKDALDNEWERIVLALEGGKS